jgi:hypothetical protein
MPTTTYDALDTTRPTKNDEGLTPNLHRHIFELDISLSGDTSTCQNACLFIRIDDGWLGALI